MERSLDDGTRARVLVCGSRSYPEDDEMVNYILTGIDDAHRVGGTQPVLIEGGAAGADAAAALWADGFGLEYAYPHEKYPADWKTYGKRAGFVRNLRMLDEGKPDIVVAFVDKPLAQSKGTAMMVDLARKAGIPVYVVQRFSDV